MSVEALKQNYSDVRRRLMKPANRVPDPPPTKKVETIKIFEHKPASVIVPIQEPVKPYFVPRDYPMIEDILEVTRLFYGLGKTEFISARRQNALANARHVAMYLCREMTPKSLPEIGRAMGGRDHTTVLHGVRRVMGLIACDEVVAAEVAVLADRVKERVAARNAITAV